MAPLRIVLDIGHGIDTLGKGIGTFKEHTFNSAVVIAAKKVAEYNKFEVILSQQPNSVEIPFTARILNINALHDISPITCVLSFHANASAGTSVSGHEVFYWYNSTKSKQLATIWDELATAYLTVPRHNPGIIESKPDDWTNIAILHRTKMPAILMEHFYFTNPNDLKIGMSYKFINTCADVAIKTVCEYVGITYAPMPEELYPGFANYTLDEIDKYLSIIKERLEVMRRLHN
jgi:N-acetylmuramoyl-L-alanine amidase